MWVGCGLRRRCDFFESDVELPTRHCREVRGPLFLGRRAGMVCFADAVGADERILVTGATGLIGSNICTLLAEAGRGARALVRSGSDVEPLRALGTELVIGDMTNEADIE